MTEEQKEEIFYNCENNPKGWFLWIQSKKNLDIREDLKILYPNLSLTESIYWLKNNLTSFPKCKTCGNEVKEFLGYKKGYRNHCSRKCSLNDPLTKEHYKDNSLKKWGVSNPAQSKEIQDKMKKTCLEKYGVENVFASVYGKEKSKQTMIEKYGVENCQQNLEIKEKTKKTLIEKYGVTCGYQLNKEYHISKGECEVFDFIKNIFPNAKHTDRSQIWPMELDIYLPDLKIGIEYDGDYWHSLPEMIERDKKKDNICKEKNIKLIRIKESEWANNKEKIKEKLKKELLND